MTFEIPEGDKIYGWAFTINPSGGVQTDLQEYILDYLEKSPFILTWKVKIEYSKKKLQRHLHGCALFQYEDKGLTAKQIECIKKRAQGESNGEMIGTLGAA